MCFSVQASFGAGALLLVAGAFSVKKVIKPSHLWFASIPLLFGIQQFSEGFVWMGIMNATYAGWKTSAMHFFLFFAQVVWPLWVPLSIWQLEKDQKRKKLLFALFCAGLVTSICFAVLLLIHPIQAQVRQHHIFYRLGLPGVPSGMMVLYFLSTGIGSFLSTYRTVQWMGAAVLASLITSKIFFAEELISVWCYFAALISITILFIMRGIQRQATGKAN